MFHRQTTKAGIRIQIDCIYSDFRLFFKRFQEFFSSSICLQIDQTVKHIRQFF